MRLPAYKADLGFTYAFGRFAVAEAVRHRPHDVKAVLWHGAMPENHLAALATLVEAAGLLLERDDATVQRLRRKGNVHCLAQVAKRQEVLSRGLDHVVLVNASHPGNVGTAIRSLVAFGFHDLALVNEGGAELGGERMPFVDPWGPYVVRASVGLRFALRCQPFSSLPDYLREFGGGRRLYVFDAAGVVELESVEFEPPFALVFGPEWEEGSVTRRAAASLHERDESISVRIAQREQVESLNLATSVSIAAYRARRQARQ